MPILVHTEGKIVCPKEKSKPSRECKGGLFLSQKLLSWAFWLLELDHIYVGKTGFNSGPCHTKDGIKLGRSHAKPSSFNR